MKNLSQLILAALIIMLLAQCAEEVKQPLGQIITPQGEMIFTMYDDTPKHKESFIELATEGYWDTLTINRVIEDFVIQGGCPDTEEGFAYSPYLLKPEFREHIKHVYGAVGIGRDGNPGMLSAGCQFYIVDNEEGLARLDGKYMIFGQLIKGYDVLDAIAKTPTDSTDTPLTDVTLDVNVIYKTAKEVEMLTER